MQTTSRIKIAKLSLNIIYNYYHCFGENLTFSPEKLLRYNRYCTPKSSNLTSTVHTFFVVKVELLGLTLWLYLCTMLCKNIRTSPK